MSETNSAVSPGPGRPRSLSPATEKTIARRYSRGDWTLAGLAEHYGISVSTVRAIVRRNPIETAPAAEEQMGRDAEASADQDDSDGGEASVQMQEFDRAGY